MSVNNVNYNCSGIEDFVLTNTSSVSIQIGLPSNPPKGMTVTIKDAAGTAATHSISVIGTIDGVVNLVMATNRMS